VPDTVAISLAVNGLAYELDVEPRVTLADLLRESGFNFTVGEDMRDAAEKVVKLAGARS